MIVRTYLPDICLAGRTFGMIREADMILMKKKMIMKYIEVNK